MHVSIECGYAKARWYRGAIRPKSDKRLGTFLVRKVIIKLWKELL